MANLVNVVFEYSEDVATHIKTFWFRPERPVQYIAGQFTELYLPHDADDRGIRRWFTLSSSPTEELVSITTKFSPERGSTFKQQLASMQPGAQLKLADPMGDFVLPKDPTIPIVFVVAGLGITPVRSMIKWLHDTGEQRAIHLIYSTGEEDELAFLPLFKDYHLKLTPVIKRPSRTYTGEVGSLNSDQILKLVGENDKSLLFFSGPESLVEFFYKDLQARGVHSSRLIADYFPGYDQA